ncbi:hypothetical protein [Flavobacterium sp. '19STA2R22 D10 B1']|uniref:hypothetical protein n=1 Tax=Flavobacterium aerium TaxID=3037261 RepID=UPI00278C20E2|nr:hypothetical protein [Flavobacterium sp. '19STA2R22 D10 B1']
MNKLLIYYIKIIVLPFPVLYYLTTVSSSAFVTGMFSYMIYRYFIDTNKLIRKNLITKEEVRKFKLFTYLFYWNKEYFKELYFES